MNAPSVTNLRERLAAVGPRDRQRLGRRLEDRQVNLTRVGADLLAAEDRVARRRASVPTIGYPEHLPVSQVRQDIARTIADHQVVVLAGETGSGKTTQLPKILLELGRGAAGLIGLTQPRRIAARAVAERVAEELVSPLGTVVGYTVRFHDQVSDTTLVKVMTDGILLAELRRDPDLLAYDTIVIDEAHERSLTIDFLLGYLKRLLPRRPDLKLVITSATIDPARFSAHFDGAPVLEVSGRTYPVEIRHRPLADLDDDPDLGAGIVAACAELAREGSGDVLVFLSGEREIRDLTDTLRGATDADIVPLFGRLSATEQHVVFAPHTRRRIVLATNVAETSLTVPGIRYVVDPGTARISRYSSRTKVQRLPIERISQASATQRAGRCGRVADGICIRLYSQEDFNSRAPFTEPEILRTNLASVLLAMAALDLGAVESFPFVQAPDPRHVRDGRQLLEELGALDAANRLTPVGRQLAQLPLDPRMARMVIEAGRLGCVQEVLVVAAALSVQDPRERPLDKQQLAAELHARFADPISDLLAWCKLWNYLREQQEALSGSAFRRMCKRELLNWSRVREWQELHSQLRRATRRIGLDTESTGDPASVSQSLLAGLLSHVGLRQEQREYLGARGSRFVIAPGTPLARKPPPLVVAAELVETNRLYARGVARIEPEWVERVGAHLVKQSYSEPHWSLRRGSVVAYERVTLYGIPIVARRTVAYGRIDSQVSRDLFIRHALVQGEWRTHHHFWQHNQDVVDEVDQLAQRTRRGDLTIDDETLYDFYDARVPAEVVSTAHFDRWWKQQRPRTPALLDLNLADLINDVDGVADPSAHPAVWVSGALTFDLSYAFEPGTDTDGVTVDVPIALLNRLRAEDFAWQVPGVRQDLVTALIKTLPKALRVRLVPAPDTARAVLEHLDPGEGPLLPVLSQAIRGLTGVVVPVAEWGPDRVPARLRPTYRVLAEDGSVAGSGKELAALQDQLVPRIRTAIAAAAGDLEVSGLTSWTVGDIPLEVRAGTIIGYPALVDEGPTVALRALATPSPAVHRAGVRRLLLLNTASPVKAVWGRLNNNAKLTLSHGPHGSLRALMADATDAAADELMTDSARTAAAFEAQIQLVRAGLPERLLAILREVATILELAGQLDALPVRDPAGADIHAQRDTLVFPGFVTATGAGRLPDIARYLQGAVVRAEKQPRDPARDAQSMADVAAAQKEWGVLPDGPGKDAIRWMIEELRLSLFAQTLKAKGPVSLQRIYRAMDDLGF